MDTKNYVAKLHEFAQRKRWELRFEDVCAAGPDHIKTFTVKAILNGETYPSGVGKNKKEARQNAAKNAMECFQDSPTESQTEATQSNASATPHPAGITQRNYICWLNEYGHKNRVSVVPVESTKLGPTNATQCCSFAVGDKEYPAAYGTTKREAKEEAAKLVYQELYKTGDSISCQSTGDVNLNISNIIKKTQSLSITTEDEGFTDTNFIGILNHYCQKKGLLHDYVFEKRTGPPHNPQFFFKVVINNKDYPVADGKNIKEAKQKAAQLAWSALQEQSDWDSKVSTWSTDDAQARLGTPPPPNSGAHDGNSNVKPTSTSDSVVFSDAVIPSKNQGKSPDVKPKIRIAANFPNTHKSKEDIMPNLNIKDKLSPIEKTPAQPVSSRFVLEYDCIRNIGKGAFGSVFKAKQILLDKYFAIKIIRCKEKALREVRALSDLNHPNIVRYYTCWMEDTEFQWDNSADSYSSSQSTDSPSQKFLYIQMELCDTKTLRVWIDEKNTQNVKKSRRNPIRREESLKIAQQLVSGVEYIHSKKLIHRDLKPANILFGQDEKVKIGDFGLVTDENNDAENLIERTVYKGTPSYMAPEQKSRQTYDSKVDIFALGLIYFELLWNIVTGQERQAIWDELRVQKLPEGFARNFPNESLIIKSLLSVQPQDRPEASKLKTDLEECAQLFTEIKNTRSV